MQKLTIAEFGAPDSVVHLTECAPPEPGPGQVLVAMEAAPINPSDLLLVRGFYGHRPILPTVPGAEGVGRIIATGAQVDPARIGERVMIVPVLRHGTWQDQVAVASADALRVDPDADVLQAAMLGINPLTADLLLRSFVELPRGAWVAQTGGNSAIGTWIRFLAGRAGLRTVSVVRRPEAAAELASSSGHPVVVSGPDLSAQLSGALGSERISLLLDGVGGDAAVNLAPWMVHGGTIVSYGGMSGSPVTIRPADLIFLDLTVRGFWEKAWLDAAPPAQIAASYARLVPHLARDEVRAAVAATYSLADHQKAFVHAAESGRSGKVLFVWPRADARSSDRG